MRLQCSIQVGLGLRKALKAMGPSARHEVGGLSLTGKQFLVLRAAAVPY